jgi:H+/Cl- antiporter ClcA
VNGILERIGSLLDARVADRTIIVIAIAAALAALFGAFD